MEVRDTAGSSSKMDNSIEAISNLVIELVALLRILKEQNPVQQDEELKALLKEKYRQMKQHADPFFDQQLQVNPQQEEVINAKKLSIGYFQLNQHKGDSKELFREQNIALSQLFDKERNYLTLLSMVDFQITFATILQYHQCNLETQEGKLSDYCFAIGEAYRLNRKLKNEEEKKRNEGLLHNHLLQIQNYIHLQLKSLSTLSEKLLDMEESIILRSNGLLKEIQTQQKESQFAKSDPQNQPEIEEEQKELFTEQQNLKQESQSQIDFKVSKIESSIDELKNNASMRLFDAASTCNLDISSHNTDTLQWRCKQQKIQSCLFQYGKLLYYQEQTNEVIIFNMVTNHKIKFQLPYHSEVTNLFQTASNLFIATSNARLIIVDCNNNYSIIKNVSKTHNVTGFFEIDEDNILLGLADGELQRLNLKTFTSLLLPTIPLTKIFGIIKCKNTTNYIAICGIPGIIFGVLSNERGLEPIQAKNHYLKNSEVSSLIQFKSNKYCASLSTKDQYFVGIIDTEKEYERILLHPHNSRSAILQIQLLEGCGSVALIRDGWGLYLINLDSEEICILQQIRSEHFINLAHIVTPRNGAASEEDQDELRIYMLEFINVQVLKKLVIKTKDPRNLVTQC